MLYIHPNQLENNYLDMLSGDWHLPVRYSSSPVVRAKQERLNPMDYPSDADFQDALDAIEEDYYGI